MSLPAVATVDVASGCLVVPYRYAILVGVKQLAETTVSVRLIREQT